MELFEMLPQVVLASGPPKLAALNSTFQVMSVRSLEMLWSVAPEVSRESEGASTISARIRSLVLLSVATDVYH